MPFKSKAQMRKFFQLYKEGKISKRMLNEWLKATPSIKSLPERARKPTHKGRKHKISRKKQRKRKRKK